MEIREIDGLFRTNESYMSCQGKRTLPKFEDCLFFFFKFVVEDTFVSMIVTLDISMEIRSPIIKRREYVALSGELMLENCRLALR